MTGDELQRKPEFRGIRKGREYYFSIEDALRVVAACRAERLAIVGMDGAHLTPRATWLRLDYIGDWSGLWRGEWDEYVDALADLSERFLLRVRDEDHQPPLMFTLVIASEREVSLRL